MRVMTMIQLTKGDYRQGVSYALASHAGEEVIRALISGDMGIAGFLGNSIWEHFGVHTAFSEGLNHDTPGSMH